MAHPKYEPTANQDSVTHLMADFVRNTTWETLPDSVRKEATRAWVNWVACATGGASTPLMDAAVRGVLSIGPADDVPVLGRSERTNLPDAALLGCLSSSAHTYDDTHLATITHPTGPVASALLATAHKLGIAGQPVSGARLLNALAIGMELECRISCAIAAGGSNLGWYMTGLSGGIGAAAAVGSLLQLTHEQLVHALGLAATQACGLRATHGSMAIAYVPGVAARNGLVSAYMAAADFSCGAITIDGRNGLLQVLTGAADPTLIRSGLGSRFEVLNNTYKPYPCGIVIHPAIDACLYLAQESKVSHQEIERVEMRVHPDALNLTWRKLPDNVLDAQVSLFHWVATAFVHRAAGVEQGELACVKDSAVRALQERSFAVADATLANNQAFVTVRLRDGRTVERFTENAIGSTSNPMTDQQLALKFRGLAKPVLGEHRTDELLDMCLHTPVIDNAAEILRLGAR
jgi:2-methylcitrate dehydratase PrpD